MHQDFASNAKCNFADFRTNTHTNSFGYESNFETLWSNLKVDEVFKHEYLRSRAYICLSLSSPFSSVTVTQI